MRVLTAMGVCDEVDIRIYKANNVTTALAQKGLSSGVKFRYASFRSVRFFANDIIQLRH